MEILSFEGAAKSPKKKRSLGILMGIAVVAGVTTLGSTLAASVTVSSGAITFGQGVVAATACDDAMVVTPSTTFDNDAGASGTFKLGSITISGIADACNGKRFIIKAYDGSNDTGPLTLSSLGPITAVNAVLNTAFATTPYNSTTASAPSITAGVSVASTFASNANQLVFTFNTASLDATAISKITVEQQNAN